MWLQLVSRTHGGWMSWCAHLKRWDLRSVSAVTTREDRPVAYLCSSSDEDTIPAHDRTWLLCTRMHSNCMHSLRPAQHQKQLLHACAGRTGDILGVSSGAGATAVDIGRYVVDLLTILVGHCVACCGPRVCA